MGLKLLRNMQAHVVLQNQGPRSERQARATFSAVLNNGLMRCHWSSSYCADMGWNQRYKRLHEWNVAGTRVIALEGSCSHLRYI